MDIELSSRDIDSSNKLCMLSVTYETDANISFNVHFMLRSLLTSRC